MKARSLLCLGTIFGLLGAVSIPVLAQHQQYLAATREISFNICSASKTWVRPTEAAQIKQLHSQPRYANVSTTSEYWRNNVFLFTRYGLSGLLEPIYLSGLWTLDSNTIMKCYKPEGITEKINSDQLAEAWLLQQRIKKIEWQGDRYVMVVEPTQTGVQFVQFPRAERQSSFTLKVLNENGQELTTIRTQGGVTTGLAVAQSTTPQPGTEVPSSPSAQPQASQELPVLRKGDTGGAVRLLQNILISLRYPHPKSRTSNFDNKTELAVKKFQSQYNLPPDGVVGASTWKMLGDVLWD